MFKGFEGPELPQGARWRGRRAPAPKGSHWCQSKVHFLLNQSPFVLFLLFMLFCVCFGFLKYVAIVVCCCCCCFHLLGRVVGVGFGFNFLRNAVIDVCVLVRLVPLLLLLFKSPSSFSCVCCAPVGIAAVVAPC